MYFLAIVAPQEIDQQVLKWKNYFKEHFKCTGALKSPAHITLIPPFWMKEELETDLVNSIVEYSKSKNKFEINLKNFAAFKPKVIYVDLIKNGKLNDLHESLNDFIDEQNKFPLKKSAGSGGDDRPFHPHVTLATRALYKKSIP